jgi:prevent-host-death family protein
MANDSSFQDTHVPFAHFEGVAPAAVRVPVKEAKAKLTELLRRVEAGARITLTRHGKPIADLVPHGAAKTEKPRMSLLERVEAWHKANPSKKIGWVAPDFDDPLPEDFLFQPMPDDFDEKLAAANAQARDSRGK